MTKQFSLPSSETSARSAAINADQVEADGVREGAAPVSDCLIDDNIACDKLREEYDIATNPHGNPEWAEDDDARETAIGETAAEIERRLAFLGKSYPFEVSDDQQ